MNSTNPIAAVAWSPHCSRTNQYSKRLQASFYQIHYLKSKRPWLAPFKYVLQFFKTWSVLARQRPKVIYVAVSPIFSALSVYIYCIFSGANFIMDVHGNSMSGWKWKWSIPLHHFLARRAIMNIVDQQIRTNLFTSWGAKTLVLERVPINIAFEKLKIIQDPLKHSVTVVNTFNDDEPVLPILEAARQLPGVSFYILGDTGLAKKSLLKSAPANVTFTGFLFNEDYWNRLYSSDAVMVLTTHPYSLLAGGQDGMALGKPLILSNQPALVDYFTKGTVFIEHTPESIVEGVQKAIAEGPVLSQEVTELAVEKRVRWEQEFKRLQDLIGEKILA